MSQSPYRGRLALLLLTAACDPASDPPPDATVDAITPDAADAADTAVGFEPPSPAPPVFTPCPEGWVLASDADGLTVCEPWPASGPAVCADGMVQLPGDDACRRVGPACPAGGFPTDLPVGMPVVYVEAGAMGGDGSAAAPFATIQDGVAAAPDGGIVAIASGAYSGALRIERDVTLWGACTDVVLDAMGGIGVTVIRAAATIRNLTITNTAQAVWGFDGSTVVGESLVIDQATTAFVAYGTDASLTITDAVVRGVRDVVFDASASSEITVRRTMVADSQGGLILGTGGNVDIEDLVARRIATAGGEASSVLVAVSGASIRLSRASLEALGEESFVVSESALTLEDVVATYDLTGSAEGTGFFVSDGGSLTADRVRLEAPGFQGLGIADSGSSATLRDAVIRDVVPSPSIGRGQGVECGAGATASLERVQFVRTNGVGILANDLGTTMTLVDVRVDGTLPVEVGTFGRALQVQQGAHVMVERFAATGSHEAAVVGASETTVLDVRGLLVEDTQDRPCAPATCSSAGIGIGSYLGAAVTVRDFRITRSALAGLQLAEGGQIDLHHGEVSSGPIGVNVQVDGYDFDRLSDEVVYRDNGVNLDAAELPVPDPTASVSTP